MRNSKNITLEIESAIALMQEIYNDIVEQKNNASLILKKMLSFMKDAEDMSVIGPVIKEQQKILVDCAEKKISLVKLQKELSKKTDGGNGKGNMSKLTLSEEDRQLLDKLVNDGNEPDKDNEKYKL
jgi:hypothetical protein